MFCLFSKPRFAPIPLVGLGTVSAVLALSRCLTWATQPDWRQLLGPGRDGVYSGPALAKAWPKEGPPVVSKREVGSGFAGPAVSGERLVLFHRVGDRALVECLDARTGQPVWKS